MKIALARPFALLIAGLAWIGIVLNVLTVWQGTGDLLRAIWLLLGYFTILTNLIIGLAFGMITLRGPEVVGPRMLAGIALSIILVGVVFALLLSGTTQLAGLTVLTNILHHQMTPVLVPVYWLIFARKGALRRVDPLLWALYPLAYLVTALLRGAAEGRFSYDFLDYTANGVPQVALTCLVILLAFLAFGWLITLLDAWLARRGTIRARG